MTNNSTHIKPLHKAFIFICVIALMLGTFATFPTRKAEAMSVSDFLATVGPMATADMQQTGILASLTMAQAILESGWGRSELAVNANALFGMKATNWGGATYWYNGTNWRAYGSWQESVSDHGRHLSTMSRYSNLVGETNYVSACYNVAADGYCPDAGYSERLIELIETYNLTQFDIHANPNLDGNGAVNLGDNFYAQIRNVETGLFLTDRDYNVIGAPATNGADQLWHFTRQSNGSYTISIDASGYCFDVAGANYNNGTNVQVYPMNGSLAQKFFIYYMSGCYYFKTVASDLVVDMDLASGNVQLYGNSSFAWDPNAGEHKARSFEIIIPCLSNGAWSTNYGNTFTAYIRNMKSGKMLTANGSGVVGAECKFSDDQKWILTMNSYGGYEIKSATTGLALDVSGGRFEEGSSVSLYSPNGTMAQTFYFIKINEGFYIKPANSINVLDMDASTSEFHIYFPHGNDVQLDAQIYELVMEKSYNNESPAKFDTDFYAYVIGKASGRALTDNGEAPTASSVTYGSNQLWHFEYDSKWNAYKITGSSGKVMDVSGAGWTDGTPICMYESNNSAAQRFRIFACGAYYSIIPACTSRVLDIEMETSTKLQLWGNSTGWDASSFTIVKITKDGKKPVDFGDKFTSSIMNVEDSLYMAPSGDGISCGNAEHQWEFTKHSSGAYTIKDKASGKVLDVRGGDVVAGTSLQIWDSNGTWAQYFFIYKGDTGYYIQPAKCHGVVDMDSQTKVVHIYDHNDHPTCVDAQNFTFPSLESGIELKADSPYKDTGSHVVSVRESTTVSSFLSSFKNGSLSVYDSQGKKVSSQSNVGTGYRVCTPSGESRTIVVAGDIDGNGILDITDIMRMKSGILEGSFSGTGNVSMKLAADLDGNGSIDTTDYMRLKGHFLGNLDLF